MSHVTDRLAVVADIPGCEPNEETAVKPDRDCIALSAWIATFSLFVALDASALTRELRWTHPEPDRPMMVVVVADGQSIASMPVEDPDADGVFTTRVSVPYGAEIQLQVQDALGEFSDLSNAEVWGDACDDYDGNGDGVIGGPDWGWLFAEYRAGNATQDDVALFRQHFGQRC